MSDLDNIACAHTALWKRCEQLLRNHHDALDDQDRLYMQSLFSRRIIWGTEFQNKRVDEIEAQFNT